jgi:hypothetical protein
MLTPFVLGAGLLAMAVFCRVLGFAYDVYRCFRYRKIITCPDTHEFAEVSLDAPRAALGAVLAKPKVRVKSCSYWPRKKGCAECCVKENWPSQ